METLFILVPFFLVSSVPSNNETWRYGPEYTFVANANHMTTLRGQSVIDMHVYQINTTLKCRPRTSDTLHCQFGSFNITAFQDDKSQVHEDKNSSFRVPFDVKFDRRGIQSLVISEEINHWYLNMMRAFVGQLNFGVELDKSDDAFDTMENSYIGRCESLVNVSRGVQNSEVSRMGDYKIMFMNVYEHLKKRGDTLVIEKKKNLEKCSDKKFFMLSGGEQDQTQTRMPSSYSRIEVSKKGFDAYTENVADITKMGATFTFREKVSLNLVSILPAKEALRPLLENATTVSFFVSTEKE